jgi:hypothetical protein
MVMGIDINTCMYFLIAVIIVLAFICSYIKKKYGFWIMQPVFHVYDFWYLFKSPTIISNELPKENKYTNFVNIKTLNSLSEIQITKMLHFIQENYHQNGDNIYLPKKENIMPYFTGHNTISFFSFYIKPQLMLDVKTGKAIDDNDNIIGVMTSRVNHVRLKNNTFDVYYVDYLCVDIHSRKRGIAPQLIQTHHR